MYTAARLASTGRAAVFFVTLSVIAARCQIPPKGELFEVAIQFLLAPNTLATNLPAWLPLRGKTSPAPGEDVTVGDKRGNLARERLRGLASPWGSWLRTQ